MRTTVSRKKKSRQQQQQQQKHAAISLRHYNCNLSLVTPYGPFTSYALSTLNAFQKYAFPLSLKTHRSIHVHSTVLMRFRLFTLKLSKTIKLYVVTLVELYAHATNTRGCDCFGLCCHFDTFSTFHTKTICMRFRLDPLLRAFLNRYVFDENAQRNVCVSKRKRISVDGALKVVWPYICFLAPFRKLPTCSN